MDALAQLKELTFLDGAQLPRRLRQAKRYLADATRELDKIHTDLDNINAVAASLSDLSHTNARVTDLETHVDQQVAELRTDYQHDLLELSNATHDDAQQIRADLDRKQDKPEDPQEVAP